MKFQNLQNQIARNKAEQKARAALPCRIDALVRSVIESRIPRDCRKQSLDNPNQLVLLF